MTSRGGVLYHHLFECGFGFGSWGRSDALVVGRVGAGAESTYLGRLQVCERVVRPAGQYLPALESSVQVSLCQCVKGVFQKTVQFQDKC